MAGDSRPPASYKTAYQRMREQGERSEMSVTDPTLATHTVRIIQSSVIKMPELYLDVYVEGVERRQFGPWLGRAGCKQARDLDNCDLVIFTGGADVHSELYGAKNRHETTRPNISRDLRDIEVFEYCALNGIPMLGVCRGAQFLHVMNGGKLYQDVDGHNRTHDLHIKDDERTVIRNCSSVHHQMCMKNEDGEHGPMEVLAVTSASMTRWIDNNTKEEGAIEDIEAFFYPDTLSLGVQGHPEYSGFEAYSAWVLSMVSELTSYHPDTELVDGYRRLRQDVIDNRQWQGFPIHVKEYIDKYSPYVQAAKENS